MSNTRIILLNHSHAIQPVGGQSVNEHGQPVRRYKKEMLRVGRFVTSDGRDLRITPDRLMRFADTFSRMKENGVDVEVVVDHSLKAEDVTGYITEVWVEGEGDNAVLFGEHEIIGQRGINLASTVKNSSVRIEDFKDGEGREYPDAITHNSFVQSPVVNKQNGFQPIAASLRDAEVYQEDTPMNEQTKAKLKELTGQDVNEDNLADVVGKIVADKDAKIKELTEGKDADPDPELVEELAESLDVQIDTLQETGAVTPAVAASLKNLLIGDKDNRNVVCLSRKKNDGKTSIGRAVVKALKENKPVDMGEKSGAQQLSRHANGGQEPLPGGQTKEQWDNTVKNLGY